MNRSQNLREQILQRMRELRVSQGDLARAQGVSPQNVNAVIKGTRPLINKTLESTLETLEARLALVPLDSDPTSVADRAFVYGFRLFPKASRERHQSLASVTAWLTTGKTEGLSNSLRSLAIQSLYQPLLSFEEALCKALPLIYGPLEEAHRAVANLGSEGDDWWDSRQIEIWKVEAQQKLR